MKTITIEQVLNQSLFLKPTPKQQSGIESGKLVFYYFQDDLAVFRNTETEEEVQVIIERSETECCEVYPAVVCVDGAKVD